MDEIEIFEASDFPGAARFHFTDSIAAEAAALANAKIKKLLGPKVYGWFDDDGEIEITRMQTWNIGTNTHVAYLFNLQRVKRDPEDCPHKRVDGDFQSGETWCMDCKSKVKFIPVLAE